MQHNASQHGYAPDLAFRIKASKSGAIGICPAHLLIVRAISEVTDDLTFSGEKNVGHQHRTYFHH